MLDGSEEKQCCIGCHDDLKYISRAGYHCPAPSSASDGGGVIRAGNLNPAAISQMNPGKRVSGTRKPALGVSIVNQLSSPTTAKNSPNTAIHFGNNFVKPPVTETPAINKPIGTA